MPARVPASSPWLAALAAILLLPPPAAAAIDLEGTLAASLVETAGPHDVQGGLAALIRGEPTGPATFANFLLSAASIRVETYSLDPATHPVGLSRGVQTDTRDFENATVRGVANRADHQFALFPSAPNVTLTLHAACSTLRPATEAQVQRSSQVFTPTAPDATVTAPTATSLRWSTCGSRTAGQSGDSIEVRGDFLLMLWEWDSELHADGQATPLPSGRGPSAYDPTGSPRTTGVVSSDRQRYLYVTGGLFTMPLGSDTPARLYLDGAAVHADAGFTLRQAQGHLADGPNDVAIDASEIVIDGSTDLQLAGSGVDAPFQVRLSGRPTAIRVDGVPLSFATQAAWPPGWAWLLGAGLVAAPATAILHRRARPARDAGFRQAIERRIQERDPAAAEILTARLLARAPQDPWAHFHRATVLKRLHREREALPHHDEARRLLRLRPEATPTLRVENALEAAGAAARIHRATQDTAERERAHGLAQEWVQEALQADANLLPELEWDRDLEPFAALASEAPFWMRP